MNKRRGVRQRDEAEARRTADERTARLIDDLRSRETSRRQPDGALRGLGNAPDPAEGPQSDAEPEQ